MRYKNSFPGQTPQAQRVDPVLNATWIASSNRDGLCATAGPAPRWRRPEVISIGRPAQPTPLAGGLAGTPAVRGATVMLAAPVMGIRREEKTAAPALAAAGREIHRAPSRKKTRRAGQSKNLSPPRRTEEEGRKNLRLKAEENHREENGISNRQNYHTFIPPLTRDSRPCQNTTSGGRGNNVNSPKLVLVPSRRSVRKRYRFTQAPRLRGMPLCATQRSR